MTQSDITISPGFIDKSVWSGAAQSMNDAFCDHPALPQSYTFPDAIVL
jgi:hypothetical protein